jgi:hypothetical protein
MVNFDENASTEFDRFARGIVGIYSSAAATDIACAVEDCDIERDVTCKGA